LKNLFATNVPARIKGGEFFAAASRVQDRGENRAIKTALKPEVKVLVAVICQAIVCYCARSPRESGGYDERV
jgi:hypothetical protein